MVDEAAAAGAEAVALPEFFTTGACFDERLAGAALAEDGAAAEFLSDAAARHGILLGGSFLCRDTDGEVRNAYLLAGPDGSILGRHDKDLPTCWENALYIGGSVDGVIDADGLGVGAAVCWEFMRSGTARRLRSRVDLVMGGSNWWSIPAWPPAAVTSRLENANIALAKTAPSVFGRYVGAPVAHGAIAGKFECPLPELPAITFRGEFKGGSLIADADGEILDFRPSRAGSGFAIAEVEAKSSVPAEDVPEKFWLHPRGVASVCAWHTQRVLGRRWYARHVRGRAPLDLRWSEAKAASHPQVASDP